MGKESWAVKYIYTDKNGKVWDECGAGGAGNPMDENREFMESLLYQGFQHAIANYTSGLTREEKDAYYAKIEKYEVEDE